MESRALVLFTTEHCTLCEQALDLLLSMPELRGRALDVVDVAEDPALSASYGPRLPVLAMGGHELQWPFTAGEVAALVTTD